MTKAENRAAAKAWHLEQEQRRREAMRADAVKADLEALRKLRHYLIFERQVPISIDALKDAIDDYAEQLTGDRRALHDQNHSIGR